MALLSGGIYAGSNIPQEGYSTSILKEPVFEYAKVIVDTTAFNNWLNSNYSKLTYKSMKGPREHLYYLIDSRVKAIYLRDSVVLPNNHDGILEILFSWSERLGVYGGSLVYNSIRSKQATPMKALMAVPTPFRLELDKDLFKISSKNGGWSVNVPYYFMIWNMNDFVATNGMKTQLVTISTGAAKDKSKLGHSQATLMFIYSPTDDFKTFKEFWGKLFAIGPTSKKHELGIKGLFSQIAYDKSTYLHKELVFWSTSNASYAVAYLGIDGTYQWNRPHFLDFLRAIKNGASLTPNN